MRFFCWSPTAEEEPIFKTLDSDLTKCIQTLKKQVEWFALKGMFRNEDEQTYLSFSRLSQEDQKQVKYLASLYQIQNVDQMLLTEITAAFTNALNSDKTVLRIN